MRLGLMKAMESPQFNDFLRKIKEDKDVDANSEAFWKLIVEKGVTLISSGEDDGVDDVTKEMAMDFLKEAQDSDPSPAVASQTQSQTVADEIDDDEWD
jgi:hypothetical protein